MRALFVMREGSSPAAAKGASETTLATASEVAARLRLSTGHVRRLAAAGELPAQVVGSSWRFDLAQVEQAIRERTHDRMNSAAVREHNRQIRERARRRAEETYCFELPGQPGAVVIVCHPTTSRDILNDPERLLREFGLVDPSKVIKMSDSWAAPPGDPDIDDEIAEAERQLEQLKADRARRVAIEDGIVAKAEVELDGARQAAARRPKLSS
jgi:excisionase family DNA binding protein